MNEMLLYSLQKKWSLWNSQASLKTEGMIDSNLTGYWMEKCNLIETLSALTQPPFWHKTFCIPARGVCLPSLVALECTHAHCSGTVWIDWFRTFSCHADGGRSWLSSNNSSPSATTTTRTWTCRETNELTTKLFFFFFFLVSPVCSSWFLLWLVLALLHFWIIVSCI